MFALIDIFPQTDVVCPTRGNGSSPGSRQTFECSLTIYPVRRWMASGGKRMVPRCHSYLESSLEPKYLTTTGTGTYRSPNHMHGYAHQTFVPPNMPCMLYRLKMVTLLLALYRASYSRVTGFFRCCEWLHCIEGAKATTQLPLFSNGPLSENENHIPDSLIFLFMGGVLQYTICIFT